MKKFVIICVALLVATSVWAIQVAIDGGTIDATTIGGTTPSSVEGTTGTYSGALGGLVPILTNDTALDTTQVRGHMDFITSTNTVVVSQNAVAGQSFCVYSTTAATVYIDPYSTNVIVLNGTALTGGNRINNNPTVAGDFICLVSDTANQWRTMGRSGTWVDSGS